MPIKPENRALYPSNWKAISRRIRFDRAGGKCELCGVANGTFGHWASAESDEFKLVSLDTFRSDALALDGIKCITIVLTVAHLNHDPRDNREENLRAYCQRHHLRHDAKHHAATARETRAKRSGQQALFGASS